MRILWKPSWLIVEEMGIAGVLALALNIRKLLEISVLGFRFGDFGFLAVPDGEHSVK